MGKLKPLPPVDFLKECFTLDNGRLIWNTRPRSHFPTARGMNSFNAQMAGKVAGTIGDRYLTVRIGNDQYKQHRIVLAMMGHDLANLFVDHDNGNSFDNSPENLRETTHSSNMQNMAKFCTNKLGKSGLYILNNTDGTKFVRFQWNENGKRKNKSFSIRKYGYEKALQLAEEVRVSVYKRLNELGANYTERHGVEETWKNLDSNP